jgi:hypothetical protein
MRRQRMSGFRRLSDLDAITDADELAEALFVEVNDYDLARILADLILEMRKTTSELQKWTERELGRPRRIL